MIIWWVVGFVLSVAIIGGAVLLFRRAMEASD